VIAVQRVSKCYPLFRRPYDRLLEAAHLFGRKAHTDFWALSDVSLDVPRGQFLAIVGPNGSGKSTLLQIVSGITKPTSGRVITEGRMAALLELGAGFNPEFTGRENVMLNGELLGLSRREVEEAFPAIESFAEIGAFIDRPVKEYSSGMYVRLAFATAIHVNPEILIVDEALAVGDAIFASRCMRKFEELKERKATILFVSHDLGLVKRLADRAVLMLEGRIAADSSPREIVNRYVGLVHEWQQRERHSGGAKPALDHAFRHGDGVSRILSVELLDSNGRPAGSIESGEALCIRVRAVFHRPASDPVAGILIRNRLGLDVYGTNTRVEGLQLGEFQPGDILQLDFAVTCLLAPQDYTLTVATQHWDGTSQDWLDDVVSFAVTGATGIAGTVDLRASIGYTRLERAGH